MIKIKLRKSKIIIEGLPGYNTFERQALSFVDEGVSPSGEQLLSIRNLWEDKYVIYRRRISEILDEQGTPYFAPGSDPQQSLEQLNELVVGASDLPEGGTTGQILVKLSAEDYQADWTSLPDLTLYFENHLL